MAEIADHTPSPATDGLREAIEALRDEWRANAGTLLDRESRVLREVCHYLDAVLAAHPAPPSETATCTCVVGVCREDDEDGCCESPHCTATPTTTDTPEGDRA